MEWSNPLYDRECHWIYRYLDKKEGIIILLFSINWVILRPSILRSIFSFPIFIRVMV
jgi:hypothetical protein